MNNTIKMIPLNQLTAWKGNVRKTQTDAGVAELAESIAAHGLLQSLVVGKAAKGKHPVIAGGRRLRALQSLAKTGRIDATHLVPCAVPGDEIDLTELSLAENVVRVAMHPADQFEAFRKLVDGGATTSQVATRFGVSDLLVQQRLKLGRLSPAVLSAYREEEIDLEQAKAFAITDDHDAQERVLDTLAHMHGSPHSIRRALTQGEVPADDRRVRFVGLETYLAAGGGVRRDLFAEIGDYLTDAQLLDRLVSEKLAQAALEVKQEGWAWVETAPERDYSLFSQFVRRDPEHGEPSAEQLRELEALEAERDALSESGDDGDFERFSELEARIDEIWASTEHWPEETLASCGAMVTVGHDGEVDVERGMARRGESPVIEEREKPARDKAALSASLVADLTAQKTAALQAVLMDKPDLALVAVVYALGMELIYQRRGKSALQLSAQSADLKRHIACPDNLAALKLLGEARDVWEETLPDEPEEFWNWCLALNSEKLLELLAYLAALSVNGIRLKEDASGSSRLEHFGDLAETAGLDMSDWIVADAAYFSRVSSALIIAALCEAKGTDAAPSWSKMKKSELAKFAERELAGTGWLPELLRREAA